MKLLSRSVLGFLSLMMFDSAVLANPKPTKEWLKQNESKNDSETVKIRCPSRGKDNCLPPGTCTSSQHSKIKAEQEDACTRGKRSCEKIKVKAPRDPKNIQASEKIDCVEVQRFIDMNHKCQKKRENMMDTCYRGGDDMHILEKKRVEKAKSECIEILKKAKSHGVCK